MAKVQRPLGKNRGERGARRGNAKKSAYVGQIINRVWFHGKRSPVRIGKGQIAIRVLAVLRGLNLP